MSTRILSEEHKSCSKSQKQTCVGRRDVLEMHCFFLLNFPAFCLILLANQIYSKISIVLFPPFVFSCVFSFLPHNSKAVVLLQIELVASDVSSHSESGNIF